MKELVFNWHITQSCNFSCNYCFATWEKIDDRDIWRNFTETEILFEKIAEYGKNQNTNIRINFAGGEPFLLGNKLAEYLKFAKLKKFRTSIITNASLLEKNIHLVKDLDILGISIDSLNKDICQKIGRRTNKGNWISYNYLIELIDEVKKINPNIQLKFNTVVCEYNIAEKIIQQLQSFNPNRIKILRQLPFAGNKGISDAEFNSFLELNSEFIKQNTVLEDNQDMTESYLMIDPKGRFFQNGNLNDYVYSDKIVNVGVKNALNGIKFDKNKFNSRYEKIESFNI